MLRGTLGCTSAHLPHGRRLFLVAFASVAIVAAPLRANDTDLRQDVAAHLAAGEIGLAQQLAASAPAEVREQLLQEVIAAQSAAGEFGLARAVNNKLAQDRGMMGGAIAEAEALAGGVVIDFQAIIDLIQAQTYDDGNVQWMDIDGFGGEIDPFQAGVRVDPHGRLSMVARTDQTGRVADVAHQARTAAIHSDMAQASALRMVSLTRLEREVADRLARGEDVVESMQQLAGLSEIKYVFFYPESQEIVIAGPAEGWAYDESGRAVGVDSGRPTLQLDDLVTLLRVFSPEGNRIFGCSIDPRAEGLQELQQLVAASQQRELRPGQVGNWAEELGEALGVQDVTIQGLPVDSRVARVIVEADYRMKLIGIERLQGGPGIPSYFDLLASHPEAQGAIQGVRWWLTLAYNDVVHSPERDAFELGGSAVLCQSENEFLTNQGERVQTGQSEPVNRMFAANFTEHYNELASREPVFADLQGVFNLALVAAIIDREEAHQWIGESFGNNGVYATARYWTPREADTVVNHRVYNGRDVVVQVAGGVTADVLSALNEAQVDTADPALDKVSELATAPELPVGRWWWDAPSAE